MTLLRCYAKITDWIYEMSGHAAAADYRFFPVYSYGFWVAVGFFAAATLATIDMRRREKLGLLAGQEQEITVGEKPNITELLFYSLFGFVVFFKVLGLVAYQPQLSHFIYETRAYELALGDYFLSMYGSWIGGILGAAAMGGYYYYSKKKEQLPVPQKKKIMVYPSDNIGDLVIIAAVLGVLGAVAFNFLESGDSIERFKQDPLGFLTSGLSVYGGLICAGIGFAVYARIKKFNFPQFFDSIAPGFILANGIGRLGCQTAGDGDWGLPNLKPKPDWVPQWLWGNTYEHNIINEGVPIPGCVEQHCYQLAQPAYPTPIYEFLMCTAIFFILWSLRKKLTYKPGMLFTIFMILIGIQRYAIEQWRELSGRDLYWYFGHGFKQSELISIVIFTIGVIGTAYLYNMYRKKLTV